MTVTNIDLEFRSSFRRVGDQKEIVDSLSLHLSWWGTNGHVSLYVSCKICILADSTRILADFKSGRRSNRFVKNGSHAGIGFATGANRLQEAIFIDHQSVSAVCSCRFTTKTMDGSKFDITGAQAVQRESRQCGVNESVVIAA